MTKFVSVQLVGFCQDWLKNPGAGFTSLWGVNWWLLSLTSCAPVAAGEAAAGRIAEAALWVDRNGCLRFFFTPKNKHAGLVSGWEEEPPD